MNGGGMGSMPPAHKPTMGYTIGVVVVIIVIYHFALGRGRR